MEYKFSAVPYYCSASEDMAGGWVFVALDEELSAEIRQSFKAQVEAWGRLKVMVKIGGSAWGTSIFYDTKSRQYQLPLKAAIRKKEEVEIGKAVSVRVFI